MSASFLERRRRKKADPQRSALVTNLLLNEFRPCLRHHRRFSTASHCQVLDGSRCNVATQLITRGPGLRPYSLTKQESRLIGRLHGRKLVAWSGTGFLNTYQCLLEAKTEMKSLKTRNLEAAPRNPRQAKLPFDRKRVREHLCTAPQRARLSLVRSMRPC